MSDTQTTKRPTHTLVRYYGDGKNARSARIGAIWEKDNGRMSIIINTLDGQIRLMAFPAEQAETDSGAQ